MGNDFDLLSHTAGLVQVAMAKTAQIPDPTGLVIDQMWTRLGMPAELTDDQNEMVHQRARQLEREHRGGGAPGGYSRYMDMAENLVRQDLLAERIRASPPTNPDEQRQLQGMINNLVRNNGDRTMPVLTRAMQDADNAALHQYAGTGTWPARAEGAIAWNAPPPAQAAQSAQAPPPAAGSPQAAAPAGRSAAPSGGGGGQPAGMTDLQTQSESGGEVAHPPKDLRKAFQEDPESMIEYFGQVQAGNVDPMEAANALQYAWEKSNEQLRSGQWKETGLQGMGFATNDREAVGALLHRLVETHPEMSLLEADSPFMQFYQTVANDDEFKNTDFGSQMMTTLQDARVDAQYGGMAPPGGEAPREERYTAKELAAIGRDPEKFSAFLEDVASGTPLSDNEARFLRLRAEKSPESLGQIASALNSRLEDPSRMDSEAAAQMHQAVASRVSELTPEEAQKAGISPDELAGLQDQTRDRYNRGIQEYQMLQELEGVTDGAASRFGEIETPGGGGGAAAASTPAEGPPIQESSGPETSTRGAVERETGRRMRQEGVSDEEVRMLGAARGKPGPAGPIRNLTPGPGVVPVPVGQGPSVPSPAAPAPGAPAPGTITQQQVEQSQAGVSTAGSMGQQVAIPAPTPPPMVQGALGPTQSSLPPPPPPPPAVNVPPVQPLPTTPGSSPVGTMPVAPLQTMTDVGAFEPGMRRAAALRENGLMAGLLAAVSGSAMEKNAAKDLAVSSFALMAQDLGDWATSDPEGVDRLAKQAASAGGPEETKMAEAELIGRLMASGQFFRMLKMADAAPVVVSPPRPAGKPFDARHDDVTQEGTPESAGMNRGSNRQAGTP